MLPPHSVFQPPVCLPSFVEIDPVSEEINEKTSEKIIAICSIGVNGRFSAWLYIVVYGATGTASIIISSRERSYILLLVTTVKTFRPMYSVFAHAVKLPINAESRNKRRAVPECHPCKPTRKLKHTHSILECCDYWIFLPNVIKIDPYIFELYRFKVGAFFETLSYSTLNT